MVVFPTFKQKISFSRQQDHTKLSNNLKTIVENLLEVNLKLLFTSFLRVEYKKIVTQQFINNAIKNRKKI